MFYGAIYCFFFSRWSGFSRTEEKPCVTRKRKSSRLSLLGIHFSVMIIYHVYLYYSYNVYCPTKYINHAGL